MLATSFYERRIPEAFRQDGDEIATKIIKYIKSRYPYAVIRPEGDLYKAGVVEYNKKVKNTLERPPIPEWYCGHVDERTGLLEDYGDDYVYDLTNIYKDFYVEKNATYDVNGNIVEKI